MFDIVKVESGYLDKTSFLLSPTDHVYRTFVELNRKHVVHDHIGDENIKERMTMQHDVLPPGSLCYTLSSIPVPFVQNDPCQSKRKLLGVAEKLR